MSVLDDLKMIHERDSQDALGVAAKQAGQLKQSYGAELKSIDPAKISNVIVGGMGGSALAAGMFQSWPKASLPLEVIKNYDLPDYAAEATLFIASSYSGNTEETIQALAQAKQKNCQIIVISAGGQLAEIAARENYPYFGIPAGMQPRMAVFYNFAALVEMFAGLNLINNKRITELHEAAGWLDEQVKTLLPDVPAGRNQAKQIAEELVGSSVVIYSGPKFFPAAYKWKINFNENSKTVAWCNFYPEFNHNEFMGWTSHPVDKPYKIVEIRSDLENVRIIKRFEISQKLLSGRRPHPEIIRPEGKSLLQQMLWVIQLGDFVSLYLALLNGLNPTPVELIEKLKVELRH